MRHLFLTAVTLSRRQEAVDAADAALHLKRLEVRGDPMTVESMVVAGIEKPRGVDCEPRENMKK
jgi:hypothetical protein